MAYEPTNSNSTTQSSEDGCADAFATVALIALIVTTVAFWLHSMPT
jgi:hypothetical protein